MVIFSIAAVYAITRRRRRCKLLATCGMHVSSVSICLTGSNYNVQAVESDYDDDDESAKPLLPPGSIGDDEAYPEEEVCHSNDATTSGRVSYQEYIKPVISWRLEIRTLA